MPRYYPPCVYDTDLSKFDWKLGERVLRHLTVNPELHHQGSWMWSWFREQEVDIDTPGIYALPSPTASERCGTIACVAGTVVLLTVSEISIRYTSVCMIPQSIHARIDKLTEGREGNFRLPVVGNGVWTEDGDTLSIENYAAQTLGLGPIDALQLFHGRGLAAEFKHSGWPVEELSSFIYESDLDNEETALGTLAFFITRARLAAKVPV